MQHGGIFITTHAFARLHCEELNYHWDYIILDEAQVIKSEKGKTHKALDKIPYRCRILLTGTPAPNNLKVSYNFSSIYGKGTFLSFKH